MCLQIVSGLLFLLPVCMSAQSEEGIGINMESEPIGAFHLDGHASAASSNPAGGGTLSPVQQSDDVVILSDGRLGIGTVSPTARLTVDTQGAAGVYPLRVRDGSQGAGKVMTSDADGHASWQTITPPPQDVVYALTTLSTSTVGYPVGTATKVATSEFSVAEDGFYSIDVRWWADFNNSSRSALQKSVTRFQLRRNGTEIVDEFKYHDVTRYRWTAFFVLYATAQAGDKLALYVLPEVYPSGAAQLRIGTLSHAQCQSKVLYKKLGIGNSNLFN
jgi:hypothetical protein